MEAIRVSVDIAAPPEHVWADIRDIASHTQWMQDAVAIRFTSDSTCGVGTTFECDTRVGPLRLTDHMEVTEWRDNEALAIRHVGIVTGEGRFRLDRLPGDHTRFVWTENLRFPWWQGGTAAALAARPVFKRLWRGNLVRLRDRVQASWNQ
jgi:uncharacterized protein YndB with AHSA1/START domain